MSIVLAVVVVVSADNVVLVCDANQLNVVDDGDDDCGEDEDNDGNRLDFLRTFILLFIFKICSLLSRISRRFAKFTVTVAFESIFSISLRWLIILEGKKSFQSLVEMSLVYRWFIVVDTKHWYFNTHMFGKDSEYTTKNHFLNLFSCKCALIYSDYFLLHSNCNGLFFFVSCRCCQMSFTKPENTHTLPAIWYNLFSRNV